MFRGSYFLLAPFVKTVFGTIWLDSFSGRSYFAQKCIQKVCFYLKNHISAQKIIHKEDNFPDNYIVVDRNVFSNGRFYGLSRRNAKDLVENKFDLIKKELCEDWAIAKYQNKDWRNNSFNILTTKIFKDRPESSLIVKY